MLQNLCTLRTVANCSLYYDRKLLERKVNLISTFFRRIQGRHIPVRQASNSRRSKASVQSEQPNFGQNLRQYFRHRLSGDDDRLGTGGHCGDRENLSRKIAN